MDADGRLDVAHTGSVDGRWLLLSLVVAVIAAVRLGRRTPPDAADPADSADGSPPAARGDAWTQAQIDARLDALLDAPVAPGPGDTSAPDTPASTTVDPNDRADQGDRTDQGGDGIAAALDRVWAEHAGEAGTLLDARLRLIVHRGIPARAIRPAPGTRSVRVVFADGTVLLCRGTGQGDFARLGLALLHHSVRLGSFHREASGTRLEFRWHPDQRLAAVAVGLDQPD